MVISIFTFDPPGHFQGQKVITPKFTHITIMMSDLSSWIFPFSNIPYFPRLYH